MTTDGHATDAQLGRRRFWPPLIGLGVILGIWELGVRWSGVAPYVLPAPSRVVAAGVETAPVLGTHIRTTLTEAGLGLLLGATASVVLALIICVLPWFNQAVYPLLVFSQTVPTVVLAPLLIIWTGFGLLPKVIVVSLTVFFPMLVAIVSALDTAGRDLVEMVRGIGGSKRDALLLVRLPAALPAALGGLRIAATYTIGAAVVAEYMAGESGLGVYIQRSRKAFAVDQIFVAVAVIGLLTAVLFLLVDQLSRRVTPWQSP
ncbi:ABC transporter permease [Nakamurella silvestris]|nr:ABC transporter permease [Nakamurella silvestris]